MGCASSKNFYQIPGSPIPLNRPDRSGEISVTSRRHRASDLGHPESEVDSKGEPRKGNEVGVLVKGSSKSARLRSFRLGNFVNQVQGEQVAAGWPSWLTAVAGEAIRGMVPLKADSFEKLEKIGQGTYSYVFKARNLDTKKIVALKKVRFDNFEPESVRFMAREIQILRSLDHPNIVKLEGIITSRFSSSLYLVFEYMEHDLAGLSLSPEISFNESQIKCYLRQMLSGVEHCHSRGVIHRDIKGANILVNNEGVVKMADFGLANFYKPGQKQPLTSRVVTLWYRPPELLLGSTDYEESIDLWSVGCVFAEMFTRRPILQGRTEVEQLHKIFKLCGSPADDYWKKSKLPHTTIFKPHHPYESCLEETFKTLPSTAVELLETLLSVEPYKRGTASTALASEYFKSSPYAADPSDLPKYAPSKEIDAKYRDELRRRRISVRPAGPEAIRPPRADRSSRLSTSMKKVADSREESLNNDVKEVVPDTKDENKLSMDVQQVTTLDTQVRSFQTKPSRQEDVAFSGPLPVSASSGFAWAKRQRDEHSNDMYLNRSSSKRYPSGGKDPTGFVPAKIDTDVQAGQENSELQHANTNGMDNEQHNSAKHANLRKWTQLERLDSVNYSGVFSSQKYSSKGDPTAMKHNIQVYQGQGAKFEFSGPLLPQSHKLDELLQKNERHVRQAIKRSWLQKVTGRKEEGQIE